MTDRLIVLASWQDLEALLDYAAEVLEVPRSAVLQCIQRSRQRVAPMGWARAYDLTPHHRASPIMGLGKVGQS